MGDKDLMFADKLFSDRLKEDWIATLDEKTGEAIGLLFPVDKLPYAGIWIDQGGWRGYNQLGIEPTNGRYGVIEAFSFLPDKSVKIRMKIKEQVEYRLLIYDEQRKVCELKFL